MTDRRRLPPHTEPTTVPRPAVPSRTDPAPERPTGDDYAQAQLGGPRGHPNLAPAPMTPQRAKKTPSTPGDGHTA